MGANVPEGTGQFFSWGNILGHPAGSKYNFIQSVYNSTPGSELSSNIDISNDAANAAWGYKWRMPTSEDFVELKDNCTSVWLTLNGVKGRLFTSNINGKQIFLPAAGLYRGIVRYFLNENGGYWASTYSSETVARQMYFSASAVYASNTYDRWDGFQIRPVFDPNL